MPNDVADWTVRSARPAKTLGTAFATPSTTTTQTITLEPDLQGLLVVLTASDLTRYVHVKLEWVSPSGSQVPTPPLELFAFNQNYYPVPMAGLGAADNSGSGTPLGSLKLTVQASAAGVAGVQVVGLYEPDPLFLALYPQPQLEPNQFPKTVLLTLAALTAQWIIQSVANVQITLFNIVIMRFNPSVANDDFIIGYSATLPPNAMAPPNAEILVDSTQTAASGTGPMFTVPLAGVQLPRGSGLWADVSQSAIANLWLLVEYSLG